MSTQKGFTLVELILVVALLAVSVGVSGDIILTLIRSYTRTQVVNEIEQNANFALLKLERELRSSSSITVPAVGASGNTLTFISPTGSTISYACVNCGAADGDGIIRRTIGATTLDLTNSDNVSGVAVECSGNCFTVVSGNPFTVQVNMLFSRRANPGELSNTVNVTNTFVLRGSY